MTLAPDYCVRVTAASGRQGETIGEHQSWSSSVKPGHSAAKLSWLSYAQPQNKQ